MHEGRPGEMSTRVRGIAAVTLAVSFMPVLLILLMEAAMWWGLPGMPWGVTPYIAGAYVAQALVVVSLTIWLRRGGDREGTIRRWFGGRAPAGLAMGVALTLPIPLTMLVIDPGVFSVPDVDRLVSGSTAVTIGPFAEEFIFRGFLFGVLWREVRLSPWTALAISSLLFGLAHPASEGWLSLPGVASTVIHGTTGALLCWVCWRRGEDLWLPTGLHAGLNMWPALVFRDSAPDRLDQEFGWTFSKIAVLVLVYAVIRWHEERRGRGSWIWTRSSPAAPCDGPGSGPEAG